MKTYWGVKIININIIMKKLIFSCLALFFCVISVQAAETMFQSDLQVGSTGTEVTALQNILIKNGFHIPSLENGKANFGKFGGETKAAVRMYQASRQIPSTGFVGPLTRAALNGGSSIVVMPATVVCPAGFVCKPSPTNTPTPSPSMPLLTSVTTPGVSGNLAISLQSTPSNGTNLDKGQTAEVARYKVQAASSDMAVSSISFDFNSRLWLYAAGIVVKDENGNIVAQDNSLSAGDFTEMTAGSSYRLSLQASYIVPKAATKYLTVSLTALANTDRSQGTVSITRAEIRAKDGMNVTDTQVDSNSRSFTYLAGTSGQVVLTANAYTPPNMRVTISTSATTDNVVLGVADFTSKGKDGRLRKLTLYVNTSNDTAANTGVRTLFSDIKVKVGDKVYSADSVGSVVTFSNMDSMLPADQKVPVAIMGKVNINTNGALDGLSASSTLVGSGTTGGASNNPVVEDSSMVTIDILDAPLVTSDITFTSNNSTMDKPMASINGPITSSNASSTIATYGVTMSFSITAGDSTLYVSKLPGQALSTTSTGFSATASSTLTNVSASPDTLAGDSSTYYVIPAGSTRSFTYSGALVGTINSGTKSFSITGVKYGTSSSAVTANTVIYYNYGQLKVNPVY